MKELLARLRAAWKLGISKIHWDTAKRLVLQAATSLIATQGAARKEMVINWMAKNFPRMDREVIAELVQRAFDYLRSISKV